MNNPRGKLYDLMRELSVSAWGVADITGLHPLADEYPRALSMAFAYFPAFESYDESRFYKLLKENRAEVDRAVSSAVKFFKLLGIKQFEVPQGGQNPKTLMAVFPHKLAAARADVGWIGKNSLLITRKFGPRIRLATILLECEWAGDEPAVASECGSCKACADACPYGYINNVEWYPGISREKLFDAHACSLKREGFRESIGRKHECGMCLLACPVGK